MQRLSQLHAIPSFTVALAEKGRILVPSCPHFHRYFKQYWCKNSALNNSQRNKDKATSVEASQGPYTPTHLLVNRPVSVRCSAIERVIQITETVMYLKFPGAIGAGAGICSHALVDKNLISFPVLCSSPATAGNLISRERSSSWYYTLH